MSVWPKLDLEPPSKVRHFMKTPNTVKPDIAGFWRPSLRRIQQQHLSRFTTG